MAASTRSQARRSGLWSGHHPCHSLPCRVTRGTGCPVICGPGAFCATMPRRGLAGKGPSCRRTRALACRWWLYPGRPPGTGGLITVVSGWHPRRRDRGGARFGWEGSAQSGGTRVKCCRARGAVSMFAGMSEEAMAAVAAAGAGLALAARRGWLANAGGAGGRPGRRTAKG